jgi:hypothetical protein
VSYEWGTYYKHALDITDWSNEGGETLPEGRKRRTLHINGTAHHLFAIWVTVRPDGVPVPVDPIWQPDLDALQQLYSGGYHLTTIDNQPHVCYAVPFAE